MRILAIDTATSWGGLALSENEGVVAARRLSVPRRYSEEIIPAADALTKAAGWRLEDLDLIAAAHGPGSFTGLRIGVATAKAFAQPLGTPVLGVSTLRALANRFATRCPRVAPMIDARRHQVFAAVYRFEGGDAWLEAPEVISAPERWLSSVPRDCLFVGDGAALYRELVAEHAGEGRIEGSDNYLVEEVCRVAFLNSDRAVPAHQLTAHYIRPSDAELNRA